MKTMTCKQMGGPCDEAFQAATSDEMMNMGAAHVAKLAEEGDAAHLEVKKLMDESMSNAAMAEEWSKKFQADFAAQPEI